MLVCKMDLYTDFCTLGLWTVLQYAIAAPQTVYSPLEWVNPSGDSFLGYESIISPLTTNLSNADLVVERLSGEKNYPLG